MVYPKSDHVTPEQRRGIILTALGVLALVVVLAALFVVQFTRERTMSVEELRAEGLVLLDTARELPEFTLADQYGEAFTARDLEGQWNLLFFGYTYCPDICPATMALLNSFYRELEPDVRDNTQIWLVSVDPGRDTEEQLHEYLSFFHEEFRGVTGEFTDLHRFATALNVPFARVPGGGDDYLVDHGGNVVLVNPNGHYVGFLRMPLDQEQLEKLYPQARAKRS